MVSENKYEWQPGMGEISGFGGGYEEACRSMVRAGMAWLDANPDADPKFHDFKGIYGIIEEDNDDAKKLSDVVAKAADGCTGAMHQAAVSTCLWIRKNGWDSYVAEMSKAESAEAVQ